MPPILLIACCAVLVMILDALFIVGPSLPEGYEDELGFHYVRKSNRRIE